MSPRPATLGPISAALVAAVVLGACQAVTELVLPPWSDGAKSGLLILSRAPLDLAPEILEVVAIEPSSGTQARLLTQDVLLTNLQFPQTLEELGLARGPLPLRPTTAGRRLPATVARWQQRAFAADGWQVIGIHDVPPVALPVLPSERCLAVRGCLVADECQIPCPEQPLPVAPFAAARLVPPSDGPCPVGWTLRGPTELGGKICAPDPVLWDTCPMGQARFFDRTACGPVGPACPDVAFGDPPEPPRPTLHVLAGAGAGGDGTLERPYSTLSEALARSVTGDRISLSRGTHDAGDLVLPEGRELVGACANGTIVVGTLTISSDGDFALRRLRLEGATAAPTLVIDRGVLSIEDVWIAATHDGAQISGPAIVALSRVVASGGTASSAVLRVSRAAAVYAQHVTILGADGDAWVVEGPGTRLVLDDALVTNVVGRALHAFDGADLEASGVAIDGRLEDPRARGRGVFVDGATASIRRMAVRDTLGLDLSSQDGGGSGVELRGSTVVASWLLLERNGPSNLDVQTSSVALRDVVAIDHVAFGVLDASLELETSTVTAARVLVEGWADNGVFATGVTGTIDDLGISGGASDPALRAVGLDVAHTIGLRVRRLHARGAGHWGVRVRDESRDVVLEDVVVDDTRRIASYEDSPAGIELSRATIATLTRASVSGGDAHGVLVTDRGTFVDLADVELGGLSGEGLIVQNGGSSMAARVRIRDVRDSGVTLRITNPLNLSQLTVSDLWIDGVTRNRAQRATGLSTKDTAIPDVSRFLVEDVDGPCLYIAQSLSALTDGTVRGCPVGLTVGGEFAVDALARGLHIAPDVETPFVRE